MRAFHCCEGTAHGTSAFECIWLAVAFICAQRTTYLPKQRDRRAKHITLCCPIVGQNRPPAEAPARKGALELVERFWIRAMVQMIVCEKGSCLFPSLDAFVERASK